MGKMSRTKGACFERECVNRAKDPYGLSARRTALSGALEHEKGDVLITPGFQSEAWSFECKRRAKLPVLLSALGDHKGLLLRADRGEAYALIRFDDLLELLQ